MTAPALAAVALICAALAVPAPALGLEAPKRPDLSGAAAAILVDARDGTVILAKDPGERRQIASTTKLMTALLALERTRPDQVFRAPDYRALPVESKINLRAGERMRVDDLLEALLLESANDAAATIAQGVSGSRPRFVADMNERARALRLADTSYANPIGLDDPLNYSSARDLATLARRLMRDERFAAVVRRPSAVLESGARRRVVRNRNDLIGRVPRVDGVKTGHTRQAGYILVGSAAGAGGARVVSVVLGEPSEAARDETSKALLGYGLAQFRRVRPLDSRRAVARADIAYRDGSVRLVPARDVGLVARRDEKVTTRVDAPAEVEGELAAGARVGAVAVLRDGEVVRRVALVTATGVPGAGPLRRVVHELGTPLTGLLIAVILVGVSAGAISIGSRRRERQLAARRQARSKARAAGGGG